MRSRSVCVVLSLVMSTSVVFAVAETSATAAPTHDTIQGSGSSWGANAVNQWVADVQQDGLRVVYTAPGSAQGRKEFGNSDNDFAVSDLAFSGTDPNTGASDTNCSSPDQCREFSSVPLVGGGVSFPYQLEVDGKRVDNLRLSGATLAGIFTGRITSWDDPHVRADNNGRRLPATKVIPVVHSEGSGTSYRFSEYLAHEFPEQWRSVIPSGEPTAYWPSPTDGHGSAQSGSDGVMNYVTSAAGNGTIGYDEYSYAVASGFPVAKVENAAGYFQAPGEYNVAIALRQAVPNPAGEPDLTKVWSDTDPRSYPLSYYTTMIIPTGRNDRRMTTARRQTVLDFLHHSVCHGQAEIGPIGYAPLPLNLTRAALDTAATLHDADPNVDLTGRDATSCANPTFADGDTPTDRLDQIAPAPAACDRAGSGPCGFDGTGSGSKPAPVPAPARTTTMITLAGRRPITAGTTTTVAGSLRTRHGAVTGAAVSLLVSVRARWHRIATVRTDAFGSFRAKVRPTRNVRYRARFAGDARRLPAVRDTTLAVRYAVHARTVRHSVRRGKHVVVSGTTSPAHPGDVVVLQRRLRGRWHAVAAAVTHRVGRGIAFRFDVVVRSRTTRLRVLRPASSTNRAATSRALVVRTR